MTRPVDSSDKFLANLCTNSERLLAATSWDALLSLAVEDFSGKSWARMSERKTESPQDAKWQLMTAVLLPGSAPARQWLTISFLPDWGGPWRKTQGGYTFRNPPLKSRSNRSHSPSRQNTILHTTDHTFSLVGWVFFPSRLFTRHSFLPVTNFACLFYWGSSS